MTREKIEFVLSRIDVSSFPIPVTLGVSNCGTKVSAALKATDVNARPGFWRRLFRGIGSAPIMGLWPAHSVEPYTDSEFDIADAAREAVHRALHHEADEHFKFDGRRLFDPHVESK